MTMLANSSCDTSSFVNGGGIDELLINLQRCGHNVTLTQLIDVVCRVVTSENVAKVTPFSVTGTSGKMVSWHTIVETAIQ